VHMLTVPEDFTSWVNASNREHKAYATEA
jgi:hypothetical protein